MRSRRRNITTETPRPGRWQPETKRAIQRSVGRALLWVVGVLFLYYVLPLDPHSDLSAIIRVIIGGVALLVVVFWQTLAVMRSTHARARAIEALAACAVVVVVAFASGYINMSARNPQAFSEHLNRTSALYFTVVTLATIGYGDITPRTDLARTVVMIQIVVNIVILGSAVRVISGLARSRPMPSERSPG